MKPLAVLPELRPAGADQAALRGTNQSGMRAHNERLVLSLVRSHGALAKSDLARITGLSAQTVSVIMRQLEQDGLLARGEPVRGRVGQPSVPMHLAAEGAFFYGLKVGRRSADLILIDFLGRIRAARRRVYRYPTPDAVVAFVSEAVPALAAEIPPVLRERIMGMGVAIPFQLWNWVSILGAPQTEMDAWRGRDLAQDLGELIGLPVYVQNDATSACGAELIFGTGERPNDFLYFYFGTFIGGGLVMNGQLFLGRTGNAAGVGPMPIIGPDGRMQRLLDVASMWLLAHEMEAAGVPSDHIWAQHQRWDVPETILGPWIAAAAEGLAQATLSAASLLEIDAVVIDGWMPAEIRARVVAATEAAFLRLDLAGIVPPVILAGTVGAEARALGAAAIPLSQRYLLDQNAPGRDG